jgi:hypothetical protein
MKKYLIIKEVFDYLIILLPIILLFNNNIFIMFGVYIPSIILFLIKQKYNKPQEIKILTVKQVEKEKVLVKK